MGDPSKYGGSYREEKPAEPAAPVEDPAAKYGGRTRAPENKPIPVQRTHPVTQDVTDSREQRKNDAGRHDIRTELYGPKQTGLESYARGAMDAVPGANLLMDEKKLEAAKAWNPNETALGDVTANGAMYAAPVGEMGQFGKWLGAKAVAKLGAETGPRVAQTARSMMQAGGIGAAQGGTEAAKHGDAGDIVKGAAIGGGLAAGLAGLGGLKAGPVAEYAPGFGNWLARQIPKAATVANRAPMATAVYQGAKEAFDPNATPYQRTHGLLNGLAVPALGTAATHTFQQGGASKIVPQRMLAEAELAGAANKRAHVEVPKKLDADYEHAVRTQREQAENHDRQRAEGEGLARDVNKGVDERVSAERKAGAELLAAQEAQGKSFAEKESAARTNATDLLDAQKLQKADHDARVAQGQEAQGVQRQEYVARAYRQARQEAESAFTQVLESYDAAKAATQGAKAANGKPNVEGVTPRASAIGEARQIHGKAGTRLSHLMDAIERRAIPDDPELRSLYDYVMKSVHSNNTAEMEGIRDIIAAGGFNDWVDARTLEIANERAGASGGSVDPLGVVSGPQMNKPTKPGRATEVAPRVPRNAALEEQIISKDLAAVPDPALKPNPQPLPSDQVPAHLRPNPQPKSVIPRKSVGQHAVDAQAAGAEVPDFRALASQEPVQGPVDNGYSGLRELVTQFAKDDQAKALAEAPRNVRGDMTRAKVDPSRSIARQYELENPRLSEAPAAKLLDLLPTFRARRVAKDINETGASDGKPLSAITEGRSRPAEATHILREVEGARGKVDARRAKARNVTGGAAASTAIANLFEDPEEQERFRQYLERESKKRRGAR